MSSSCSLSPVNNALNVPRSISTPKLLLFSVALSPSTSVGNTVIRTSPIVIGVQGGGG